MDAALPYRPVRNLPKTGKYETVNAGNHETVTTRRGKTRLHGQRCSQCRSTRSFPRLCYENCHRDQRVLCKDQRIIEEHARHNRAL